MKRIGLSGGIGSGKSYVAELLKDAGANYLWKENENTGSVPLTFEQVYSVAKDADFWINLSTLQAKQELLSFESQQKPTVSNGFR